MLAVTVGTENVTDRISGLTYSNVDPGGFEACQFTLRNIDTPPSHGDRVTVWEGLQLAWTGRVEEAGLGDQRDGKTSTIRVAAVGDGARLRGSTTSMIYVDRDGRNWRGPGTARLAGLEGLGYFPGGHPPIIGQKDPTSGNAGVVTRMVGAWGIQHRSEAWYDAGVNNLIDKLVYAWVKGSQVNSADVNWSWTVESHSYDGTGEVSENTGNLRAAGPGSGTFNPTTNQRYVSVYLQHAIAAGSAGVTYDITWTALIAFGDHALTIRGAGATSGLYASDIAMHAGVITGIRAGVIQDSSDLTILQAAYRDPVPRERIIDDMAKAMGWHWGVWEANPNDPNCGGRLDFRAPPADPTAVTGSAFGAVVNVASRASAQYNSVKVRYQDPAGGPGVATVTIDNPFVPAGETNETTIDMGQGTASTAADFGRLFLLDLLADGRGAGDVQMPLNYLQGDGQEAPSHLLRAGLDRLKITDLPNKAFVAGPDTRRFDSFRIRRVSVDAGSAATPRTTVEVDAGMSLMEVLQARLAVAVDPNVVG